METSDDPRIMGHVEMENSIVCHVTKYSTIRGVFRGDTAVKRLSMREKCEEIRKSLNVAVKMAASSCELEAKFSFHFNEVHRR